MVAWDKLIEREKDRRTDRERERDRQRQRERERDRERQTERGGSHWNPCYHDDLYEIEKYDNSAH